MDRSTFIKGGTMAKPGDIKCWEELHRALPQGKFKVWFWKPEKNIISLCSEEIDNKYSGPPDDARWEIYLYKNGTWAIV